MLSSPNHLLLDNITLSTSEKEEYDQLWAAADVNQWGFITGADAVPFFAKSGLPPQTLGQANTLNYYSARP